MFGCSYNNTFGIVMEFFVSLLIVYVFTISSVLASSHNTTSSIYHVTVSPQPVRHVISPRFLSLGLEPELLQDKDSPWHGFDMDSPKLIALARGLAPAHLRFGGNSAQHVLFVEKQDRDKMTSHPNDVRKVGRKPQPKTTIIVYGFQLKKFYMFLKNAGIRLILDLNAVLRDSDNRWDPTNAYKMLRFMAKNNLTDNVDLELGNEPNSYRHHYNVTVNGTQLASDTRVLYNLIRNDEALAAAFHNVSIVGPSVTRPRYLDALSRLDVADNVCSAPLKSNEINTQDTQLRITQESFQTNATVYLQDYLSRIGSAISAITWHQYYICGRTATLANFTSPDILDYLPRQIATVRHIVNSTGHSKFPVWLGETASAYGGGAPGLSDRFAGGFMWLDKLGVSARDGLSVVVRQSLYKGYYSLLQLYSLTPNPDYWIALLYKQVVGTRVLTVTSQTQQKNIRFYTHCTAEHSIYRPGSVVFYGMNLGRESVEITIGVHHPYSFLDVYLFTAPHRRMTSRSIMLNGRRLAMEGGDSLPVLLPHSRPAGHPVHLPGRSLAFYVLAGAGMDQCMNA